jgi:hypothetical protein
MSDGFDGAAKRAAGQEKHGLSGGLTRRRVVQGAAWSVPVIAIAAPVPAFAGASQGVLTFTGENCKLPGNSSDPWKQGAVYLFSASNTTAVGITVDITSVLRSNSSLPATDVTVIRLSGSGLHCSPIGTTFPVAAGATGDRYALVTSDWPSSANGNLVVNYEVDDVAQTPATGASNDLSPITSNPSCDIGGSCNTISDAFKKCILRGLGFPACPTI